MMHLHMQILELPLSANHCRFDSVWQKGQQEVVTEALIAVRLGIWLIDCLQYIEFSHLGDSWCL